MKLASLALLFLLLFSSCQQDRLTKQKDEKAILNDFLVNNKPIFTNQIRIIGTKDTEATQLKYKAYMTTEKLKFSVPFKVNSGIPRIRVGRHIGGCMDITGNTMTIYRPNSGLTGYEIHDVLTIPFSLTLGETYLATVDKSDEFHLTYSITSNKDNFSKTYSKLDDPALARIAIAWGTPFFGVVTGDITIRNAILATSYASQTSISVFGDSFIEGTSMLSFGLKNRWVALLAKNVGADKVHISGKGGERADANFATRFKVENNLFNVSSR